MLIIRKSKSGTGIFRFELGTIETVDANTEPIRYRFGDSRPVIGYKIIGRHNGVPITLGEYMEKQDRDEAFERFTDAFVYHNCDVYESVEEGGETIFRPFRMHDGPVSGRCKEKGEATDNGDSGFRWILKSYNDGLVYGEEYIRGFHTKAEAETALKELVEQEYQLPWDEIPKKKGLHNTDVLLPDYVAIADGGNRTDYFIVEEIKPGKNT